MKRNVLLFLFFAYAVVPPEPAAKPDDVLVFVVTLEPARCKP